MDIEHQITAARTILEAQAAQLGITADELVARLGGAAPAAAPGGITLAGYYPTWLPGPRRFIRAAPCTPARGPTRARGLAHHPTPANP